MTNQANTFICEYNILPDNKTRDTCLTLFGGMTYEDDLHELGDVKLLGRWACVGEARGYCVAQAKNVSSIQRWLTNWVPMADIKVTPCLDDNQQRELILGKTPSYIVPYTHVGDMPKTDESLYFIKYQFKPESRNEGFKLFSMMSQEHDKEDSGNCTSYGRWHVPSQGCGYAIASAPSVFDVYKWAYNWNELCDVVISPVTDDTVTREIIQSGVGYKVKHDMLVAEMSSLMSHPSIPFWKKLLCWR
tara:strand:- start:976 stop:1713 length:738 start_codon:yes stop_codon:yes gene_type:complete